MIITVNKKVKSLVAATAFAVAVLTSVYVYRAQALETTAQNVSVKTQEPPSVVQNVPVEIQSTSLVNKKQWGNNFVRRIESFKESVNVDVSKIHDPKKGDAYLYFYVINKKDASDFSVDVSCADLPAKHAEVFNIAADSKESRLSGQLTDRNLFGPQIGLQKVTWVLTPKEGVQAIWFYATTPPIKRRYSLSTQDSAKKEQVTRLGKNGFILGGSKKGKTGFIEGPSCSKEN